MGLLTLILPLAHSKSTLPSYALDDGRGLSPSAYKGIVVGISLEDPSTGTTELSVMRVHLRRNRVHKRTGGKKEGEELTGTRRNTQNPSHARTCRHNKCIESGADIPKNLRSDLTLPRIVKWPQASPCSLLVCIDLRVSSGFNRGR